MLKVSEYADRLRSISIDCSVEGVLGMRIFTFLKWLQPNRNKHSIVRTFSFYIEV